MDNLVASSENVRKLTDAFSDPEVAKNLTASLRQREEHPPGESRRGTARSTP